MCIGSLCTLCALVLLLAINKNTYNEEEDKLHTCICT